MNINSMTGCDYEVLVKMKLRWHWGRFCTPRQQWRQRSSRSQGVPSQPECSHPYLLLIHRHVTPRRNATRRCSFHLLPFTLTLLCIFALLVYFRVVQHITIRVCFKVTCFIRRRLLSVMCCLGGMCTRLYGVTSNTTVFFIVIAVGISNLVLF